MALDREEFREAVRLIREDVKGVNDRLDALNGRTREAEQQIAVLEERTSARAAALLGGGVGGVVIAAVEAVKWYFHTP